MARPKRLTEEEKKRRIKERNKKWRESTKGQESRAQDKRFRDLKTKYDMTIEEYDNLLEKQNHVCAICKRPETIKHFSGQIKRLAVDHCHSTGKIRGLLCFKCNTALGKIGDEVDILQNMVSYLRGIY